MKQVPSADFRKSYANEKDAVEVTSYGTVIGTWYPVGTSPVGPDPRAFKSIAAPTPAPAPRMSVRPEKGPKKDLKQTVVPIADPLELRRLERERWSTLQAKLSTGQRKVKSVRSE